MDIKVISCRISIGFCLFTLPLLTACEGIWNNPNVSMDKENDAGNHVLYTSFSERPKYLDPARSYSSNEYAIIAQVYEPPLQYHYLARPYRLTPLTATAMPTVSYLTATGETTDDMSQAVYTAYDIEIKPSIYYQPHPAFVQGGDGKPLYFPLAQGMADNIYQLSDFPKHETRELVAADYVYQIKRLADPASHSPVAGLFAKHIVGFAEFREALTQQRRSLKADNWLDLRKFDMKGIKALGPYRYRILVDSVYPQFVYWLSMPFFSPMPWEADAFYSQPQLARKNINLNWYPIGTGAYMMTENNPNLRMVIERNPHHHDEFYPSIGEAEDKAQGLLLDAGKKLPFIDKVIFSLEKEDIPRWNKFLQGYYDSSGVSSDNFDQAIDISVDSEFAVSVEMAQRGIELETVVAASVIYTGFNMLDPVVGGLGERAVKLRQALSIAVDFEEYISIFLNGRGIPAQSPLPPGIFGDVGGEQGLNSYIYEFKDGRYIRKSIAQAKRLLGEAGYANGIDQDTGEPLVLYFDAVGAGPDAKSFLNWMRKQFAKLNIQLVIRNTDYNRFQEKMLNGSAQIFRWGWNADYPDPENFLFLLYGNHSKAKTGGSNGANYRNPEFDRLYETMKSMENDANRLQIIRQMIEILQHDAPWMWGFFPKSISLHYDWYSNIKLNLMANNTLKYHRLDPALRAARTQHWNEPVLLPLLAIGGVILLFLLPAVWIYYRRLYRTAL